MKSVVDKILSYSGNLATLAQTLVITPSSITRDMLINNVLERSEICVLPKIVTYRQLQDHTEVNFIELSVMIAEEMVKSGISLKRYDEISKLILSDQDISHLGKLELIRSKLKPLAPSQFALDDNFWRFKLTALSKQFQHVIMLVSHDLSGMTMLELPNVTYVKPNLHDLGFPQYSVSAQISVPVKCATISEFADEYDLIRHILQHNIDADTIIVSESRHFKSALLSYLSAFDNGQIPVIDFKKSTLINFIHQIWDLCFSDNKLENIKNLIINPSCILHERYKNHSFSQSLNEAFQEDSIVAQLVNAKVTNFKQFERLLYGCLNVSAVGESWHFALSDALKQITFHLEGRIQFNHQALQLLIFLIERSINELLNKNSTIKIVGISDLDFVDFRNIIFVENGLAQAEQRALESDCFEIMSNRIRKMMNSSNIMLMRFTTPNSEESIFYTLCKTSGADFTSIAHTDMYYVHENKDKLVPSINISQSLLPKKLSVTNITALISNPYIFAVKNLLRICKTNKLWEELEAKDFGILVHDVLSKLDFTNPRAIDPDRVISSLDLSKFTKSQIIIFKSKLLKIIIYVQQYYIENPCNHSLPETYGQYVLQLDNDCNITIYARADRIDVIDGDNSRVIDFKTGILPTLKDVRNGAAPQLPIEAWLLSCGGFPIPNTSNVKVCFLKVPGTESGQEAREIDIEISVTQVSLTELLRKFYISNSPFFAVAGQLSNQFSDYAHLYRYEDWLDQFIKV